MSASNQHPHIKWVVTSFNDEANDDTRTRYNIGEEYEHRPTARGVQYKEVRCQSVSDCVLREEEKLTMYCKTCWPHTYTLQDQRKAPGG